MARHIRSTAEAVAPVAKSTEDTAPTTAQAVFIDNLSREHKFADGSKFLFVSSRAVVTNPTIIANLKAVVSRLGSKVFLESETAPAESTQTADETAEAQ